MVHRIEDVVARGMCIGCGGCAVATQGAIPIELGTRGLYQANLVGTSDADRRRGSSVCPFSDESLNEDELGAPVTEGQPLDHDPHLGSVGQVVAGRRVETQELIGSSSGGLTSWLLERLLDEGDVDGVIHVGSSAEQGMLYEYVISESFSDVEARRKSQYYPTSFSDVLTHIRGNGLTYAFVGVPCFVRSVRNVAANDPVLAGQLRFYVGLVCGHLKSQFFAESLAWQLGTHPDELGGVDFRVKNQNRPASRYDFGARSLEESELTLRQTASLVGGNWGHGAFQPEGCNFCDDVFAETADVVFGDAWLPEYSDEWRGTNVVVTRNDRIAAILDEGRAQGTIDCQDLPPERATASQGGNFRHRRDGLAVRLADDLAAGLSVPRKRVQPGYAHVPRRRVRLIRQRRRMSELSFSAYFAARKTDDLSVYTEAMRREATRYARIEMPAGKRAIRALRNWANVVVTTRQRKSQ